jgi:hypothetical protein
METQATFASFDAKGIEAVLSRTTAEGNSNFDETIYATTQNYAKTINGIEVTKGSYPISIWSPIRTVTDANGSNVQVRNHTVINYDEGAPSSKIYGLPTTQDCSLLQPNRWR